jgi:3-dehydroquinate synthetase
VKGGLPVTRPGGMEPARIIHAMRLDKKGRAGAIEYALPRRIGQMAGPETHWGVRLDDTLVRNVLAGSTP